MRKTCPTMAGFEGESDQSHQIQGRPLEAGGKQGNRRFTGASLLPFVT